MNRFFGEIKEGFAFLSAEDSHHLSRVLRIKKGEEVEIVSQGELYLAQVISASPLSLKVKEKRASRNELPSDCYIAFALLKGGHDELVLQKCTELGAKGFLPFLSKRTIIKLDHKEREKRGERYRKIVLSAAAQSKRLTVPSVSGILDFKDLLAQSADYKFIAYENLSVSNPLSSFEALSAIKEGSKTIFLIGPEGGFEEGEVASATKRGFVPISLGRRILRAETASIFLSSVFSYLMESKE